MAAVAIFISPGLALADFEGPAQGPQEVDVPVQARPWDLTIRLFAGRDSNVPLAPDQTFINGDRGSMFGGGTIKGTYRLVHSQDWSLGVMASADYLHFEKGKGAGQTDSPDEYQLSVFNPGIFVRRKLKLGAFPASLGLSYDYRRERSPIPAGGLDSATLKLDGGIALTHRFRLAANATYGHDDFSVAFPDMSLNSRDAKRTAYGLSASYRFPWRQTTVKLNYARAENNAEGRNFDYDGHKYSGRVETRVTGPLWLGLEMGKDSRDYKGFQSGFIPAPGRTEQDIYQFNGQLLWQLSYHWIVDLFYEESRYRANQPQFEAERRKFGLGATYRF